MSSADEAALEARDIGLTFGTFVALEGVSVCFRRGGITGIVGPNGAGKSTLFNVLGGQVRPDRGAVLLDGTDMTRQPPHMRARRGLTRTFQISRELGALTVLENLLLAFPRQPGEGMLAALRGGPGVKRAEDEAFARASALLRRVNLWRLADAQANALSGGQKKLLELCRALMLEPRVVLLDEPAAGVNPVLVGELCDFIRTLRDEGLSFGIVEHNMDLVAALCDPIHVLAEGRLLTSGSFDEISSNTRVTEAYLGGVA